MDEQKPKPRNPAFDLPIFDSGFTQFPTFLIDELMPFATGVPASFWKYMIVLWRDLFGVGCDRKGYRAAKTMTQFHMDKDNAARWTAALSVSGLFTIAYGRRYGDYTTPGIPTVIQYRPVSTLQEWECFVAALRDQILDDKSKGNKNQREGTWSFRIGLSFRVDNERQRRGLTRLFDNWHKELEKSGDIRRTEEGFFQWSVASTNTRRVRTATDLRNEEEQANQYESVDERDLVIAEASGRAHRKERLAELKPKLKSMDVT